MSIHVVGLSAQQVLPPIGVPNGYSAYYPFDTETQDPVPLLFDPTVDGFQGVTCPTWRRISLHSAVTTGAPGVRGQALDFPGNLDPGARFINEAGSPDNPINFIVNGLNSFTLCFWYKGRGVDNNEQSSLIGRRMRCADLNNNGNNTFFDIRSRLPLDGLPAGTIHAAMMEQQNDPDIFNAILNNSVSTGGLVVGCDNWIHVAVTREVYGVPGIPPPSGNPNWSVTKLFINGARVDLESDWAVELGIGDTSVFEISGSGCLGPTCTSWLGCDPFLFGDDTRAFDGLFDELLIYDDDLSEAQILSIYQAYRPAGMGAPTVTTTNDIICPGETANLTASVTGAVNPNDVTYTWMPGGFSGSTISVTPSTTTTYTVQVQDFDCVVSGSATVTVQPPPVFSLIGPNSVCDGESITLELDQTTPQPAGSMYQWGSGGYPGGILPGETSTVLTRTPTTSEVYWLEVTSPDGCKSVEQHPVVWFPSPNISLVVDDDVCGSMPQITLSASPASPDDLYWWLSSSGGISDPYNPTLTDAPGQNTSYFLLVTNQHGCQQILNHDYIHKPSCCPIVDDPNYVVVSPDNSEALSSYGISFNATGDIARINDGNYHILPSRLFIPDGVTLTVSNPNTIIDLTNADVVFGPCAQLRVRNDAQLLAYNSVFRNCDPASSWHGIDIRQGNSSTSIKECTFLGADIAIDIRGDRNDPTVCDIAIQNNLFSNNRIGINARDFASTKQISGNTFQVDDVDGIVYHDNDCNPLTDRPAFIGMQFSRGKGEYLTRVSQNDFINGVGAETNVTYTGISVLERSMNLTVSGNHFTDMFRSVDINHTGGLGLDYPQPIMIENNHIEVTRDFAGRDRGNYQIRIDQAGFVEVVNNRIISSAEAPQIDVPVIHGGGQITIGEFFMNGAIMVTGRENPIFSQGTIRENEILGFEVGIHAINTDVIRISENEIKSHYYGIFAAHDGTRQTPGNNMVYIKCNDIEMDSDRGTTSVGISFHLPMRRESFDNHYVVGNCIKNTHRAIEVIQADLENPERRTNRFVQMPTILNNFLYNYVDAGIFIFGHNIGGNIGDQGTGQPGHNSFFGNNIPNPDNFDVIMENANNLNMHLNDFGNFGGRFLSAGGFITITGATDVGSFATCSNQDENNNDGYIQYDDQELYACGDDDRFGYLGIVNGMAVLEDPINVWDNYMEVANEQDQLTSALMVLSRLSDTLKKQLFFDHVSGQLVGNDARWFAYAKALSDTDYTAAQTHLDAISATAGDEADKLVLAKIQLDLEASDRTEADLTGTEINNLYQLHYNGGTYANAARSMLFASGLEVLTTNHELPIVVKSVESGSDEEGDYLYLYPNPAQNELYLDFELSFDSNASINIFNMQGELIQTRELPAAKHNKLRLDISELSSGTYFVTVLTGEGLMKQGKFVKQ